MKLGGGDVVRPRPATALHLDSVQTASADEQQSGWAVVSRAAVSP